MTDTPPPTRLRTHRAYWLSARGCRDMVIWLALAGLIGLVALVALAPADPLVLIVTDNPVNLYHHLLFEHTIASQTPDSMTYIETDDAGAVTFSVTVTTPDQVRQWYAYVNGEPSVDPLTGCGGILNETPTYRSYTFSARGVIIETATAVMGTTICAHDYQLSAGGQQDPYEYFLSDPYDSPTPPPVGHQEVP